MSSQGTASPGSKPANDNPYYHLPKPLLIKYGSIYLGIMCGVALLWYTCHVIRNWGRWKVLVPDGPQYIRTWHGYIKHSRYERVAKRKERFKEMFRGRLNWKTTKADCKWMFFDPTGVKQKEYHLRRERTFLRYLPQWMRSWEPEWLPADEFRDLEQGVDSAQMFRIDLPPRYSQISQSIQTVSQVDDPHSCVEVMPDYPFMTGALPDCCDCPIAHTIRRKKDTDLSHAVWHANGRESSRVVCNQLLMSRKDTNRSVVKDVQSVAGRSPEALWNTAKQVTQRAVSLACGNMSTPVNTKTRRYSISIPIDTLGKMQSDLGGLDRKQGLGVIRCYPHNKETSASYHRAEPRTTAIVEAPEQHRAQYTVEQSTAISNYYERRRREVLSRERRALDTTTGRANTDVPLSRVSRIHGNPQAEAFTDAPNLVQNDCQASVPSFLGVLGRILRYSNENNFSQTKAKASYGLQSKQNLHHSQPQFPEPIELGGVSQTDGHDDPKPLKQTPNGKLQRVERIHPKSLRGGALTDTAIEGPFQVVLWPHRVKVLSTIDSPMTVSELTLEKKENIPFRISPAPVRRRNLWVPKRRSPLGQYSGNADTLRERSLGLPDQFTPSTLRKHFVTLPTATASKQTLTVRVPSCPKQALVRDVYKRLEWLGWELTPGFRTTIYEIPPLLDLADPQPIGMCGGTFQRIHRRTRKEILPQSRYYRQLDEVESDTIPADTAIATDTWIAPQPPHGLSQAASDEKPPLYSRGGDALRTLNDWQDLNGQKPLESLNPANDEDRYQRPIRQKRVKFNYQSVPGLVVQKLRRIEKLSLGQHQQIANGKAEGSHQDVRIGVITSGKELLNATEHEKYDVGTTEVSVSTEQEWVQEEEEVDHSQTPGSDSSTLLGTEEPLASPTLLDDDGRLETLTIKNEDPFTVSASQWHSQPYKVDLCPFDEHPLSRFHNSYSGRSPPLQVDNSQITFLYGSTNSSDTGADRQMNDHQPIC